MEMLEHVPQPDSVVAACHHLVKPGGHLFFSTINKVYYILREEAITFPTT